jgi:hypothetical protein
MRARGHRRNLHAGSQSGSVLELPATALKHDRLPSPSSIPAHGVRF